MKRILMFTLIAICVGLGSTRVYDIEPYRNYNGKAYGPTGIAQVFTCTCDSFLWAEFFVGASNDTGYNIEIRASQGGQVIFEGYAEGKKSYDYTRADLHRRSSEQIIKGKEYELRITLTSNPPESINYYYDPTNPYKYGLALVPPQGSQIPLCWDLAVRIEGITRIPQDLFGTEIEMSFFPEKLYSWDACADSAKKMGVTWDREGLHLMWRNFHCQPDSFNLDYFNWSLVDSLMLKTARHSIKVIPYIANYTAPDWAIHARKKDPNMPDSAKIGLPCVLNLFEPETVGNAINPLNFLAHFVYHFVKRYGPSPCGTFWDAHPGFDAFRVKYLEVGGEANLKLLMSYWDTLHVEYYKPPRHYYYDTTYRVKESTYIKNCYPDTWKARRQLRDEIFYQTLVVAASAAKLACPDIKILAPQIGRPFYAADSSHEKGIEFLSKLYESGLGDYADIITASCYQEDLGYFDWNQFKMTVDTIRAIMNYNHDAEKELWTTEYGFNVRPGWNTELNKANAVLQAYLTTIDGTEEPFRRLDRICWFCFTRRLFRDSLPPEDTGYVLTDTSYKGYPAYFAYKQMTERLKGKIFNQKVQDSLPGFYTYELEDTATKKKFWVAWKQSGIGYDSTKFPVRTDSVVRELINYDQAVSNDTIEAEGNGYVTLIVDTTPVYLFENQDDSLFRPDLVIDSLKVKPDTPYAYARCTLYCWIRNVGGKASQGLSIKYYQDDSLLLGIGITRPIQPDSVQLMKAVVFPVVPQGPFVFQPVLFKVVVNSERRFVELSYDNNTGYRHAIIRIRRGGFSAPIDWVTNPFATAYNSQHKLVIEPNPNNLLLIYNNEEKVDYSFSPCQGDSWNNMEVTSGAFSSIEVDTSRMSRVAYLKDDTVFGKIQMGDSTWKTVIVYAGDENGKPGTPVIAQPCPKELAQYCYCLFPLKDPSANLGKAILLSEFDIDQDNAPPPQEVATGDNLNSPSIAITPGDYLHIVWEENGEIYYRTSVEKVVPGKDIVWSDIYNISETPEVISEHPAIETYGENIIVAWKEGEPGEIVRRVRNLAKEGIVWLDKENVSQSPDKESDYPVLSTMDVVAWQEKVDSSNYEIYAWIKGDIVNISETGDGSKFPQIAVEPAKGRYDESGKMTIDPKIVINAIWTEEVVPESLYEVKFRRYEHSPTNGKLSEYITVEVGDSMPSSYCESRAGFVDYGEFSCDYDNSSLIYNIPYLNPASNYLLRAVVYKEGSQIGQEEVYVDTTFVTQVIYTPYVPETVCVILPKETYENDLEVSKEIERVLGSYALLADLKVYEVNLSEDSSGGGAQGNTIDMKRYALYQNHPNPFKDLTKITFAIPRECKVSLFVYNVTGRRVRTLIDDKMKPGDYNLKWDGKDNQNRKLSNGIYFYRLQTEDFKDTKKTILLK
jgi:hypothetical protein